MIPSLRSLVLGAKRPEFRRYLEFGLAVFVVTFVAIALTFSYVSRGVVSVQYSAAVVGLIVAFWVGYRREGLLLGWVLTYTALLGFNADHAFLGLSSVSLSYRLSYFVRLSDLALFAVEAVVLGTLGCVVGHLLRWAINDLRSGSSVRPNN